MWEFALCFSSVFLPFYTALFLPPPTEGTSPLRGSASPKGTDKDFAPTGNEHWGLWLKNLPAGLESNLLNKLTFVSFFPLLPEKYFLQKIDISPRDWFGSHLMYTARQGFKVEGGFSWIPEMIANWWEIWRKIAELVHSLSLKLKECMCLCICMSVAFTHLCVCVLDVSVYVWCLCSCVNACEKVCGWWYGTCVCWVGYRTCVCVCVNVGTVFISTCSG